MPAATVVAQGTEAGGHVRGTTPLATLLAQVIAVVEVPMIAARGIASGAALAEVLNAGAGGARVGTRFLATSESGAHREYVAALLEAKGANDTVYATKFDQGWPDAPHRVLRVAVERAAASADPVIGEASYADQTWEVVRWSAQPRRYSRTATCLAWRCTPGAVSARSPTFQQRRRSSNE